MTDRAYSPRGSYQVCDECRVCRVLVAPGDHLGHEATAAHQLNLEAARAEA